jgi:hypothetical protein
MPGECLRCQERVRLRRPRSINRLTKSTIRDRELPIRQRSIGRIKIQVMAQRLQRIATRATSNQFQAPPITGNQIWLLNEIFKVNHPSWSFKSLPLGQDLMGLSKGDFHLALIGIIQSYKLTIRSKGKASSSLKSSIRQSLTLKSLR